MTAVLCKYGLLYLLIYYGTTLNEQEYLNVAPYFKKFFFIYYFYCTFLSVALYEVLY